MLKSGLQLRTYVYNSIYKLINEDLNMNVITAYITDTVNFVGYLEEAEVMIDFDADSIEEGIEALKMTYDEDFTVEIN